ncbi:MAG: hypothetical protein VKJ24_20590 [Synechococcales bacterium]|nr:hypothetical protein [Synechococcales bacterium]
MLNGFKYGLILSVSLGVGMSGFGRFFPIAQAQQEGTWVGVYRSLFGGKPPVPKGSGGSRPIRPEAFCSLVPGQWGQEKPFMLRSRPTWVWRGAVESLQLEVEGQKIWQQAVNIPPDADGLTRMGYSGPPLEPGRRYRLVIKRPTAVAPVTYANFQMIAPEKRSRLILQQNQMQEAAWRSGKRGTALLQERVSFLTQQGLWLDVAQEILSSTENSAEWQEMKAGIVSETCGKPPEKSDR